MDVVISRIDSLEKMVDIALNSVDKAYAIIGLILAAFGLAGVALLQYHVKRGIEKGVARELPKEIAKNPPIFYYQGRLEVREPSELNLKDDETALIRKVTTQPGEGISPNAGLYKIALTEGELRKLKVVEILPPIKLSLYWEHDYMIDVFSSKPKMITHSIHEVGQFMIPREDYVAKVVGSDIHVTLFQKLYPSDNMYWVLEAPNPIYIN